MVGLDLEGVVLIILIIRVAASPARFPPAFASAPSICACSSAGAAASTHRHTRGRRVGGAAREVGRGAGGEVYLAVIDE